MQVGRTSVVVAHRLSTIRNADLIALVFRGAILEQVGGHREVEDMRSIHRSSSSVTFSLSVPL